MTKPHRPSDRDLLLAAGTLSQYARYTNAERWSDLTDLILHVERCLLTTAGADAEPFGPDLRAAAEAARSTPADVVSVLDTYSDDERVADALLTYIDERYDEPEGLELAAHKYRNPEPWDDGDDEYDGVDDLLPEFAALLEPLPTVELGTPPPEARQLQLQRFHDRPANTGRIDW